MGKRVKIMLKLIKNSIDNLVGRMLTDNSLESINEHMETVG